MNSTAIASSRNATPTPLAKPGISGFKRMLPLNLSSGKRPKRAGCPFRVKPGKAQCEHMFSALPLRADIAQMQSACPFRAKKRTLRPLAI
jgi:hypothetical protein